MPNSSRLPEMAANGGATRGQRLAVDTNMFRMKVGAEADNLFGVRARRQSHAGDTGDGRAGGRGLCLKAAICGRAPHSVLEQQ